MFFVSSLAGSQDAPSTDDNRITELVKARCGARQRPKKATSAAWQSPTRNWGPWVFNSEVSTTPSQGICTVCSSVAVYDQRWGGEEGQRRDIVLCVDSWYGETLKGNPEAVRYCKPCWSVIWDVAEWTEVSELDFIPRAPWC